MLVADEVGVGPPVGHVGMVAAVGAHDRGPALHAAGQRGVVVFQFVHPLEIELERALRAVDLEAVAVLIAGGLPGGLEAGDRPAGESGEEQHGVVDGDLALCARARAAGGDAAGRHAGGKRPFLDERLGNRARRFR